MAAAHTLITMTAQRRSSTADDGIEHLAMLPCKMRSVVLPKSVPCCMDDVGHLKGGPVHRFFFSLERFTPLGPETSMVSSGLGTACRWRRDKCR
jgi:hypothetical protein